MQKGSGGVYKGFGFYMAYSMGHHISQMLSRRFVRGWTMSVGLVVRILRRRNVRGLG